MPTSQFTIYSSDDPGAPILNGATGSLLSVLNGCLVTGYGAKLPAGWKKPFPDTGSRPGSNIVGAFTMPSGSGFTMFVNDGALGGVAFETSVTGWEVILNPTGSIAGTYPTNVSSSVGGGRGQFPTPAQLLTTGRVVWRKSNAANMTPRPWKIFADGYTVYVFMATYDTLQTYYCGMFGDIFAYSNNDIFRCQIAGRTGDNAGAEYLDAFSNGNFGGSFVGNYSYMCVYPGHFMARSWQGFNGGSSIKIGKGGDLTKLSDYHNAGVYPMSGILTYPNPGDNSIYLSPVFVNEVQDTAGNQVGPWIRGHWRGWYHVCHAATNFSDGQIFQGSGEYAGRSFQIIKQGSNLGFWAMETSATVDTN